MNYPTGLSPGLYTGTIRVMSDDAINRTATLAVNLTILPHPGDMDKDGDVDQTDFGWFQACFSGAGVDQNDSGCDPAKLTNDNDVGPADFNIFFGCMSGADIPATPGCGNA